MALISHKQTVCSDGYMADTLLKLNVCASGSEGTIDLLASPLPVSAKNLITAGR